MNICFVTSECAPYVKTGGLADVAASLPRALAELGHKVKIFMPLYGSVPVEEYGFAYSNDLYELPVPMGDYSAGVHVWYGTLARSNVEIYLVDYPPFFHRTSIYTNDADEGERFILLQRAAFAIMQRYAWSPDVIHCNDWHTALMPAMRAFAYAWDDLFRRSATVLTLHNVGYQGRFGPMLLYKAGLPFDQYYPGGPLEFHGSFNFLKAGVEYADVITTVSPTYAHEILSPAYGEGLEGPLQRRSADVYGILNGIDVDEWNPSTDQNIYVNYDFASIEKKEENKRLLLTDLGLPVDESVPLLGIVSRLVDQKGFDLLHPVLEPLLSHHNVRLVVLGSGQANHEDLFRWAQNRFPERVRAHLGYSDQLAHRIEAGADIFLMPSRYEPCGLNQMYSLRYGTIPVVRKTGGLADTVHDYHETGGNGNGFSFHDYTPHALFTSILRACTLFPDKTAWRRLQKAGMTTDFSWAHTAGLYERLYERAVAKQLG